MPEIIQRSFTGGEIAPALRSRADINKYATGLAKLENMFIKAQGGAYSRQGTKFICEIGDSTKQGRLIPFSFNSDQTYILLFEENTMRVIRDGGLVLENDAITIFELATPYLESELSRLSYTQRADVMTIVHPNHGPRNLSRTADNEWTLDLIDFTPRIQPPAFEDDERFTLDNITNANPTVVTTNFPHGYSTGDTVIVTDDGMSEIEAATPAVITVLSDTTFALDGVDSLAFGTFSGVNSAVFRTPLTARGTGGGDFDRTYEYVLTAVDTNGEESVASAPQSFTTNSLSETYYMLVTWSVVPTAAFYNVYKAPSNGSRVYGFIGTSKTTFFEDYTLAPITSDSPPELRDPFTFLTGTITDIDVENTGDITTSEPHGLISGDEVIVAGVLQPVQYNGTFTIEVTSNTTFKYVDSGIVGPLQPYTSGGTFTRGGEFPSTVNYYQQRLVFGNTLAQRQTVFTSQTGNFDSLRGSSPSRADDAITFTIAAREVNEIRHIVELDAMVLLTSGGTFRVTEGDSQVLTPATVGVRKQSNVGCNFVLPVIVDSTVIFIQSSGARVRDMNYDFSSDKFGGSDLSIMAEHLLEGFQITDMSHAEEPYGIIWLVRSDGKMLGLTYQREQQVWGWHQHTTDGLFESIATIEEDFRDAPYVIVNRTIEGVTRRYVERMEPRVVTGPEDVWCVDSGLQLQAPGISTVTEISGLDHLEGKDVAVVADGNVVSGLTVTSGAITLPREASKVTVGLGYTCTMETLDLDIAAMKEVMKSKDININEVTVAFENSRGASAGSLNDDGTADMQEFKPRYDAFGYGAIPLSTWQEDVYTSPSWEKGGGMRIQQTSPMPMAVLAVIPNVDAS